MVNTLARRGGGHPAYVCPAQRERPYTVRTTAQPRHMLAACDTHATALAAARTGRVGPRRGAAVEQTAALTAAGAIARARRRGCDRGAAQTQRPRAGGGSSASGVFLAARRCARCAGTWVRRARTRERGARIKKGATSFPPAQCFAERRPTPRRPPPDERGQRTGMCMWSSGRGLGRARPRRYCCPCEPGTPRIKWGPPAWGSIGRRHRPAGTPAQAPRPAQPVPLKRVRCQQEQTAASVPWSPSAIGRGPPWWMVSELGRPSTAWR